MNVTKMHLEMSQTAQDERARTQARPAVTSDLTWAINLARVLGALAIGAFAYGLANLIQFHFLSQTGLTPQPEIGQSGAMFAAAFGDVVFSGVILVLLLRLLRISGLGLGLIAAFGLFAMMGSYSTAVRGAPDFYAALYSENFVSHYLERGF